MSHFSKPPHQCCEGSPHGVSSEYLGTSKVRKVWTFNPFYPELSGMLITFILSFLGLFWGVSDLELFPICIFWVIFVLWDLPNHPKNSCLFPIPFLFSFLFLPIPVTLCSFSLSLKDWVNPVKIKIDKFSPTWTLKVMFAFWDRVSRYVLVSNIFIFPGVSGTLFEGILLLFLKYS